MRAAVTFFFFSGDTETGGGSGAFGDTAAGAIAPNGVKFFYPPYTL